MLPPFMTPRQKCGKTSESSVRIPRRCLTRKSVRKSAFVQAEGPRKTSRIRGTVAIIGAMETTTIELVQTRDLLDTLALVFTISTGIVIAGAALFATAPAQQTTLEAMAAKWRQFALRR